MPVTGPRLSKAELVLSVSIWSGDSGELEIAGAPARDESLRPHRIDLVDTRDLDLINPWKLGKRYFVTSRSSDEEQFHAILERMAEVEHVALGTMLLGDEAISVMLKPAGTTFELFPVLAFPKSAASLPLGPMRIATIHVAPIAMTKVCSHETSPHEPHAVPYWNDVARK